MLQTWTSLHVCIVDVVCCFVAVVGAIEIRKRLRPSKPWPRLFSTHAARPVSGRVAYWARHAHFTTFAYIERGKNHVIAKKVRPGKYDVN